MNENRFQTDNISANSETSGFQKGFGKKRIRISKKTLVIVGILYLLLCGAIIATGELTHSVQGPWVRGEDDAHLAGMIVEVKKDGAGQLEGIVTQMGEIVDHKFKVGQIKWTNIKRVGTGRYTGFQLTHSYDEYGRDEWYYGNRPSIIYISFGGKDLYLEDTNNGVATGMFQHWTKRQ